jgi:hypothetical protein
LQRKILGTSEPALTKNQELFASTLFIRALQSFHEPRNFGAARAAGNPVLGLNRITSTSWLGAMFQLQGTRLLSGRLTALKLDSILSPQFD